MGKVAFSSHEKGKNHQREILVRRTNLQINNISISKTPVNRVWNRPNRNKTLDHSSYRSSGADVSIFKKMFPDSEIAARMEMGRTKTGYLITYGTAPYFANDLFKTLQGCSEFVVGFDETLNKIVQRQQMDIGVRFWNPATNQEVEARYIGSAFLSSTRSNDLVNSVKSCFYEKPELLKNVIQCSMDGPAVNWKMFKELTGEIQELRSNPARCSNSNSSSISNNSYSSGSSSRAHDIAFSGTFSSRRLF
ncbi:uncharacterized protein LOC135705464 [Ochlerotatus camptorhynchus]|uniref:uncharacterized protein LOC135705464 n=1 Tax=Ochlerotatus camptorhynchus TaxID=644619 RepID=UPI0031D1CED0